MTTLLVSPPLNVWSDYASQNASYMYILHKTIPISGPLSVMKVWTNGNKTKLRTSQGNDALFIDPDGKKLWVSDVGDNGLVNTFNQKSLY